MKTKIVYLAALLFAIITGALYLPCYTHLVTVISTWLTKSLPIWMIDAVFLDIVGYMLLTAVVLVIYSYISSIKSQLVATGPLSTLVDSLTILALVYGGTSSTILAINVGVLVAALTAIITAVFFLGGISLSAKVQKVEQKIILPLRRKKIWKHKVRPKK